MTSIEIQPANKHSRGSLGRDSLCFGYIKITK